MSRPQIYSKKIIFLLTDEMHADVLRTADLQSCKISEVVRAAIEKSYETEPQVPREHPEGAPLAKAKTPQDTSGLSPFAQLQAMQRDLGQEISRPVANAILVTETIPELAPYWIQWEAAECYLDGWPAWQTGVADSGDTTYAAAFRAPSEQSEADLLAELSEQLGRVTLLQRQGYDWSPFTEHYPQAEGMSW